ncbi:hypothetical protein Hamer_G000989 [Homarus americanus]|uniref:Uncharacterized protein n=1 Tax=Homarus americanus TaxID=6706 RepID=A0A8J5N2D9_HOMAM|nr:hypothetical protein Hamer_G000989 [Homarus americanus]
MEICFCFTDNNGRIRSHAHVSLIIVRQRCSHITSKMPLNTLGIIANY